MNTRTRQIATGASSVALVGLVVAGVFAFGATASTPEPTPTPTTIEVALTVPSDAPNGLAEEQEAVAAEAVRVAAEAEQARIAAEQAAAAQAEADRIAAEQAAQEAQNDDGGNGGQQADPVAPPAPPAPIRCPAGSSATESDGTNDLACLPDICWGLTIPDVAHPECDRSFRP